MENSAPWKPRRRAGGTPTAPSCHAGVVASSARSQSENTSRIEQAAQRHRHHQAPREGHHLSGTRGVAVVINAGVTTAISVAIALNATAAAFTVVVVNSQSCYRTAASCGGLRRAEAGSGRLVGQGRLRRAAAGYSQLQRARASCGGLRRAATGCFHDSPTGTAAQNTKPDRKYFCWIPLDSQMAGSVV